MDLRYYVIVFYEVIEKVGEVVRAEQSFSENNENLFFEGLFANKNSLLPPKEKVIVNWELYFNQGNPILEVELLLRDYIVLRYAHSRKNRILYRFWRDAVLDIADGCLYYQPSFLKLLDLLIALNRMALG